MDDAKRSRAPRIAPLVLPPLGVLPLPAPLAYAGALALGAPLLAGVRRDRRLAPDVRRVGPAPRGDAPADAPARLSSGWLAGVTMNVAGFIWLQNMLADLQRLPRPLICFFFVLVVCGYQGGRIGLLGWLYGARDGAGVAGAASSSSPPSPRASSATRSSSPGTTPRPCTRSRP